MNDKLAVALLVSVVSNVAIAENNQSELTGTSEDSSTVSIDITGGNDGFIILSNLSNIDFGDFGASSLPVPDADGNVTKGSNFCVYRTGIASGAVSYGLDVTTLNTEFLLKTSVGGTGIAYSVDHYQQPGFGTANGASVAELSYGDNGTLSQTENGSLSYDANGYNCSGDNGSILVKIPFSSLINAEEGEYSDVLTLTVTAN